MDLEAGATRYALTVIVYLSAVTIDAARFIERGMSCFKAINADIHGIDKDTGKRRPGYFDSWGLSHQIFYVHMAVGLTVHFSAFAKVFSYAHKVKQC